MPIVGRLVPLDDIRGMCPAFSYFGTRSPYCYKECYSTRYSNFEQVGFAFTCPHTPITTVVLNTSVYVEIATTLQTCHISNQASDSTGTAVKTLTLYHPRIAHSIQNVPPLWCDMSRKADTRIEATIATIVRGPHSIPANGKINMVNLS